MRKREESGVLSDCPQGYTAITEYGYDQNGNLTSMKYPGGRVITYNYSSDRVISVLNNTANLATNIQYKPFGGMTSLTYGNGLNGTIGYDNQYRIISITVGQGFSLAYTHDANGNITGITNNLDTTKNKTYTYDALDRLTGAVGPWGSLNYSYDGVGNRQKEMDNSNETTYAYTANKLISTTGTKAYTFSYDSNGNTISENGRQYIYNQNQRLIKVTENGTTKGEYTYNGNGQRARKTNSSGTMVFHYDLSGQLMAESTATGTIIAEYLFLNGNPLAKIEGNNIYYYHNDHLGTPQKMTDSSGTVVWYGEFLPFGEPLSVTGTITNNIRFPGQYYDEETGLNYNYYRDYNPVIGRYIETDPIGLAGGINFYTYAGMNPIIFTDPMGLECVHASGMTYVGLSHKIFPYLHNIFHFKLPCGADEKAENPQVSKSQALSNAPPKGRESLTRQTAFNLVYFESKCNEPGIAIVEVETRIITQPGAMGFLLNNLMVCYECKKCCK